MDEIQNVDAERESLHDIIQEFWTTAKTSIVVSAALFAYLAQPLVRFLDAGQIYWALILFFIGLYFLTHTKNYGMPAIAVVFGCACLIFSLVKMTGQFDAATQFVAMNDQRCLAVEREMLSARPRRDDLPEIFTSLACTPRSDAKLALPDRQSRAKP